MADRARQGLIDAFSGLILVIVGVGGLVSLARNPSLSTFNFGTDPGPAFVPRLLLVALLAGGIGLIGLGVARTVTARVRVAAMVGTAGLRRHAVLIAFVLSLAVYLAALPRAGFVPATLVFSAGWIAILTQTASHALRPRDVVMAVVAAAVITGALFYVFRGFVKVPLP